MGMVTYPLSNTKYYAEDAELYNATRTSGVWSGEDFDFSADGKSTMISVGEGLAWIKNSKFSGKVVAHKETEIFDFGVSDPSYSRIDVLAIRYDALENNTSLVVKKGTPSSKPEIPQRATSETEYELFLFSVLRTAGSKTISNSDITDLRDDENYCGYMQNAVQGGYAPSLMEHNKGYDFRLWVGTSAEFELQKDKIKKNTFCIFTDENDGEKIREAFEEVKAELEKKAPSGYGLGEAAFKKWSEVDALTATGWYRFSDPGKIVIGGNTFNYAYMRVDAYNQLHATQTIYPVGTEKLTLQRIMNSKVWGEWDRIVTGKELEELNNRIANLENIVFEKNGA